uniref:Uncharacterized protein n=1 Tax=Ciona savignyi TaxID=51511 RepID=H2Y691_CIOSA
MESSEESSNNNDILQPLLKVKSGSGCNMQTYWYRWYILLQFSLFAFIQTLVSNMWSPIVQSTEVSLNFTSHDFDLLANWGVIGVLCFIPLNMWLLVQYGMRLAVVSGMFFVFIGCGIKCLPWSIHQLKYIIHIGQICNGI